LRADMRANAVRLPGQKFLLSMKALVTSLLQPLR
jgi:hypothetical protein